MPSCTNMISFAGSCTNSATGFVLDATCVIDVGIEAKSIPDRNIASKFAVTSFIFF